MNQACARNDTIDASNHHADRNTDRNTDRSCNF